ncbi:hypothetical protein CGCF415_v009265 [Colletotrichum fructicola]|nr:uncharacterized protein CGMCC3_g1461 [Colletotrichum fructicola]KAE9582538.1 hypothetical protein CGMCC3_g1461 [Colletotrichum fructicola]KAF4900150.1 hypothetical protein CGCFRS4_v003551 [Colletotrichum fructicola]KAF4902710.1 hypothetical protein CGCF415_v009265 [Colletotrichum fructicola]KAF4938693.1 hypothetical protein CGCF245_v004437 [Colletotrichum fructicola]
MKAIWLLSVATLSLTVQACDSYKYCACTNKDGTTNDDITNIICENTPRIHDQGFMECKLYKNIFGPGVKLAFDNCKFRKACQAQGAMGDSRCRAKVGIFKA